MRKSENKAMGAYVMASRDMMDAIEYVREEFDGFEELNVLYNMLVQPNDQSKENKEINKNFAPFVLRRMNKLGMKPKIYCRSG